MRINTLLFSGLVLTALVTGALAAPLTGYEGAVFTVASGHETTIDLRNHADSSNPGFTLSYIYDDTNATAGIFKIHRQAALWQWQSLDHVELSLNRNDWDQPSLTLYDSSDDPSVVLTGGNGQAAYSSSIVLYDPFALNVPTIVIDSGMAATWAGSPEPTISIVDSTQGTHLVTLGGLPTTPWDPGFGYILVNGSYVVTQASFQASLQPLLAGSFAIGTGAIANSTNPTTQNSFALGLGTQASGTNSLAFGYQAQANGTNSLALGYQAKANGFADSVAIGRGAEVTVSNSLNVSVAIGGFAKAKEVATTAIGKSAEANGANSIGFGTMAKSYGTYSMSFGGSSVAGSSTDSTVTQALAFGYNAHASGAASTAVGPSTNASGSGSSAFGSNAQSSGYAATALGFNTIATGPYQTVLGYNNQNIGTATDTILDPSDVVFIVGNGKTDGTRSNAMTIRQDAGTAIGDHVTSSAAGQVVVGGFNDTANSSTGNHAQGRFIVGIGTSAAPKNAMRVLTDGTILIRPSGDLSMGLFNTGEQP